MVMPSPGALLPWASVITRYPAVTLAEWACGEADRVDLPGCLDHIVIFANVYLRHVLAVSTGYYNELRTHLSLDKDSPSHRPIQRLDAGMRGPSRFCELHCESVFHQNDSVIAWLHMLTHQPKHLSGSDDAAAQRLLRPAGIGLRGMESSSPIALRAV